MADCAWVTGAGSGVGRAIAQALGSAGLQVAVSGRREGPVQETVAAIREAGGVALAVPVDVTEPRSVEEAYARIRAEMGEVTVLVNNAGVHGGFARIVESDPDSWMRTLATNVCGPYLTTRLCVPAMRAAGRGWIVQVGSAAGLAEPGDRSTDYVLSKVALNYLTRQFAADLHESGVVCCVIHPGEVRTGMWKAIHDDALARGPEGEGALEWARMVDESGGDAPEKAAGLVLRILQSPPESVHGRFLWIEDGIQSPRPTW
ncbi:MAG: SDR family NAD(P)-dependent oxidoreductase [Armatimonadota bacterium]